MVVARVTATIFLLLAAFPAAAGELGQGSAQMACETDVHRLCEDVYPDIKLVAACLVDKRSRLTTACAEQLAHPDLDDAEDD